MSNAFLLAALVILFIYMWLAIAIQGKVPVSISDTFYYTGHIFTLVMFLVSLFVCLCLLSLEDSILSFSVGASLAFVGASPLFKTTDRKVHYISALICAITSQLWVIVYSQPLLMLVWSTAIIWYRFNSWCFWAEVVMLFTLTAGVYLH